MPLEMRFFTDKTYFQRRLQYREPVVKGDDSVEWIDVPEVWEEDEVDDDSERG